MALVDALRDLLWRRDQGKCGICKKPVSLAEMSIDHIIPRAFGGPDVVENLRPAHMVCNLRRGNGRIKYSERGERLPRNVRTRDRNAGFGIHQRSSDGLWCATMELSRDPISGRRRRRVFFGRTPLEARGKLLTVFPKAMSIRRDFKGLPPA